MRMKEGRKAAAAATMAPAIPATLYPTYAASMRMGPGVNCPSASPSTNSVGVSQWNWSTT